MDINFRVVVFSRAFLVDDIKKIDEIYFVQVVENGIYIFCFDNLFSVLVEKIVYVDLGFESDEVDSWLSLLQGDIDVEIQEI